MSVTTKTKNLNQWSRDELMALPVRDWLKYSEYDSVLLLSTRRKHESGWAMIAIIGVREGVPVEIAASCCDDIEWKFPPMQGGTRFPVGQMRMDCALRSGAIHVWTRVSGRSVFRVGEALSSVTIELIRED
jgi:hypothetical protein